MLPVNKDTLQRAKERLGIVNLSTTTIHRVCALAAALEAETGEQFVHLELSNPAMPASTVGVSAECTALRRGVAGIYPNIDGLPTLKEAAERFFRLFFNISVPRHSFVPVAGSIHGSFTVMSLLRQMRPDRDTIVFICPGFAVQLEQARILGYKSVMIDVYDCRGEALEQRLADVFASNKVGAIVYSVPSNPAWTNFTEDELRMIGEAASANDVWVIEDQACCGMDFREDYSVPGKPPYVPTVARYTDLYVLLLSASKIFNYAGQRIGLACISPQIYNAHSEPLQHIYRYPTIGECYVRGLLFNSAGGTTHSSQYALAAMLNAACDGTLDFIDDAREYELRSALAKQMFCDNGFHIVYDNDLGRKISDGIYFTVGYKAVDTETLQNELFEYGISTISLPTSGSSQPGVSVSVASLGQPDWFAMLEMRLRAFNLSHHS
jgi:aspartate/methionine/tyrosine aminotransferase